MKLFVLREGEKRMGGGDVDREMQKVDKET